MGGGSVLDTGKIVALQVLSIRETPWDFFIDEHKIPGKIPLVTVLTLVATGSEMNHNAVITNEETLENSELTILTSIPPFPFLIRKIPTPFLEIKP